MIILDRNVINYPKCHSYGPIILRVAKIVKKFVICNNRLVLSMLKKAFDNVKIEKRKVKVVSALQ